MIVQLDAHRDLRVLSLDELRRMDIVSPAIQRTVDQRRVNDIVDHQRTRHARGAGLFFSGSIVVWQGTGGSYLVVDGQHRLEAMRQLHVLDPDYRVVVEVLKDPPGLTIETAFQLVNSGQPVPEYIKAFAANARRRPVLEEFAKLFDRRFKKYVSKSPRPNRPNVNVTQLLDRLNECPFVDRFRDGADLLGFVAHANARLTDFDERVRVAADKKAGGQEALYLRADDDYEWLRDEELFVEYRAPARALMDIDWE